MAKKRKKGGNNAGTMSIIFIVLVFLVVMSVQIYKLKEKDDLLAEVEADREAQLQEQIEYSEEIEELEKEVNLIDYIIKKAHEIGLVFPHEKIFKESDE